MRAKQGMPIVGVEVRVVGESGDEQPWDGQSVGELQVRGPVGGEPLLRQPRRRRRSSPPTAGSAPATWSPSTPRATSRSRTAPRTSSSPAASGSRASTWRRPSWATRKVLEAAVIAVPHPRWVERPLACVVPKPEHAGRLTTEEILDYLRPLVAKWWLPDDVVFIDAVPKTSVGKFDKKVLRERFKDWSRRPRRPQHRRLTSRPLVRGHRAARSPRGWRRRCARSRGDARRRGRVGGEVRSGPAVRASSASMRSGTRSSAAGRCERRPPASCPPGPPPPPRGSTVGQRSETAAPPRPRRPAARSRPRSPRRQEQPRRGVLDHPLASCGGARRAGARGPRRRPAPPASACGPGGPRRAPRPARRARALSMALSTK